VKRRIPCNAKDRLLIINDNQQHLRQRKPLAFAAASMLKAMGFGLCFRMTERGCHSERREESHPQQ